jgi:protein-tyrosine-phosphatase
MAKSLLFVCGANRGRSVASEYTLRNMLKERDEEIASQVKVSSAGLMCQGDLDWLKDYDISPPEPMFGRPAYRGLITLLQERGIDISGHRSRELTSQMIAEADLIIVSEEYPPFREAALFSSWPQAEEKTFTFSEFVEAQKAENPYLISESPHAQPYPAEDSYDFSPEYWESCVAEIEGYLTAKLDKFLSYLQLAA